MSPANPRRSIHPGRGARGFLTGLTYPFRGIAFLVSNRGAWRYAVVPGLLNFSVLLVVFVASLFWVDDLVHLLRPDFLDAAPPPGEAAAGTTEALLGKAAGVAAAAGRGLGTLVVYVLSFLLATGGALVTALVIAAALAGPFQERLSEVVEQLSTGETVVGEKLTPKTLARDGARGLSGALQRAALFGAVYVPLLALSFLPVIGVVGAAGTLLYTSFFGALNFMDPSLERQKLPLRRKIAWGRERMAPWLGFGAALVGLLFVPLVGLLLTPAFVTGGTLLWIDAREP